MKKKLLFSSICSFTLLASLVAFNIVQSPTTLDAEGSYHKVIIHFNGIEREDEVVTLAKGEELTFSLYQIGNHPLEVTDDKLNSYETKFTMGNEDVYLNFNYLDGVGPIVKKDKVKVIVMSGQSNAAGVGRYPQLRKSVSKEKLDEYAQGYDNVLMYGYSHNTYINEFKPVYADEFYSSGGFAGSFGFELPLAEHLSNYYRDSGETIYLVKSAFGGATLDYDYRSPSVTHEMVVTSPATGSTEKDTTPGWLYRMLIKKVDETIKYILSIDKIPEIEAFFWQQGESEGCWLDTRASQYYYDNFVCFMNDFKGNFSQYLSNNFTTIDGAISSTAYNPLHPEWGKAWPYYATVNAAKQQYANEHNGYFYDTNNDPKTTFTTMYEPMTYDKQGDTHITFIDYAHYDATSYLDLGHGFATRYLSHFDPTYTQNALKIGSVSDISVSKQGTCYVPNFVTKYNGAIVKPFYLFESEDLNIFNVNEHGKIIPVNEGSAKLRISTSYKDEVNVKLVNVTVTA